MSGRVCSFPPVARPDARLLILGSMPGAASLAAHEYYANPHNQFWRIMGVLCDAGAELPYSLRLARLQACGIALWDVFESCARPGSLDSAIDHATAVVNDIPALLQRCPRIRRICCNGATAYAAFQRHLGASLSRELPSLHVERLPSTSPANARWSPARKLAAWHAALAHCGIGAGVSVDVSGPPSTTARAVRYQANVRHRHLIKERS